MPKILVVDDSAEDRNLVKEILGQQYEVLTADSWVHTTEYVYKHDLDLILLDVNMPGLKGDELAKLLKQKVKSKPLNIVLFSAIDEAELRRKAKEVGATGYIAKTFDGDLLLSRVRKFL